MKHQLKPVPGAGPGALFAALIRALIRALIGAFFLLALLIRSPAASIAGTIPPAVLDPVHCDDPCIPPPSCHCLDDNVQEPERPRSGVTWLPLIHVYDANLYGVVEGQE